MSPWVVCVSHRAGRKMHMGHTDLGRLKVDWVNANVNNLLCRSVSSDSLEMFCIMAHYAEMVRL